MFFFSRMRGRGVADFSRFFVLESIPISWIKVSIIMLINWEVNWHQYMFPCLCILYKTPTKYPHLYHLQHLDAVFNSYLTTSPWQSPISPVMFSWYLCFTKRVEDKDICRRHNSCYCRNSSVHLTDHQCNKHTMQPKRLRKH